MVFSVLLTEVQGTDPGWGAVPPLPSTGYAPVSTSRLPATAGESLGRTVVCALSPLP